MKKSYAHNACYFLAVLLILAASACKERTGAQNIAAIPAEQKITKETITKLNLYLNEKDKAIIKGYAKRHKLSLNLSDKGFYYHIFDEGKGKAVGKNGQMEFAGSIKLIDGTSCYSYTNAEPKIVVLGKSPEFMGLQMALPMLREGGKAIFIFPPNLAYGLLGDGNKIPARSLLVAELELLKVE